MDDGKQDIVIFNFDRRGSGNRELKRIAQEPGRKLFINLSELSRRRLHNHSDVLREVAIKVSSHERRLPLCVDSRTISEYAFDRLLDSIKFRRRKLSYLLLLCFNGRRRGSRFNVGLGILSATNLSDTQQREGRYEAFPFYFHGKKVGKKARRINSCRRAFGLISGPWFAVVKNYSDRTNAIKSLRLAADSELNALRAAVA